MALSWEVDRWTAPSSAPQSDPLTSLWCVSEVTDRPQKHKMMLSWQHLGDASLI